MELISLIAPTSQDRIAHDRAERRMGLSTVVSSLGVTGMPEVRSKRILAPPCTETVRQVHPISQPPSALEILDAGGRPSWMAELADGVIVGSAIVKLLEQHGKDAPGCIGAYVKTMKDAIR